MTLPPSRRPTPSGSWYAIANPAGVALALTIPAQNLKLLVFYLVLSPFNNEQSDFSNRVFLDKNLEEIPVYRYFLPS